VVIHDGATDARNLEKREVAGEESLNRDLIRGIERGSRGDSLLHDLEAEGEARESLFIRRFKLERERSGEVEATAW
jgi:hypothetical protein